MSDVPHRTIGDEVELGSVLALLHGTDDRFRTVRATYRTWRHEQRLHEAFRANTEAQKRRGVSFAAVSAVSSSGEPAPSETEETVRIWREGQRLREELHGGRRDGYYGLADGPLWWFWGEQMGAMSNQDNPSAQSAVGQRLQVMLNPIPLLSSLHFRVTGNSQVAGRAAVTAHAIPRPHDLGNLKRLRETLRVFLGAGSSFKAAADELHLHPKSVTCRVQRAVERRGKPITDDRLDVEVVLLLCHWFDTAVPGSA